MGNNIEQDIEKLERLLAERRRRRWIVRRHASSITLKPHQETVIYDSNKSNSH